MTPGPAIWLQLFASSVLLLITNIIFIFIQLFFRDCLLESYTFVMRLSYISCIYLIERIQRRNKQLLRNEIALLDIHSCLFRSGTTKEEDEIWLNLHITSWKDGNITTTGHHGINCLETDLLNLKINVGTYTIRILQTSQAMAVAVYYVLKFDKAQPDKLLA